MSLKTAVSVQPKLNLESVITQGGHVTTASEREAVQGTGDEACLSLYPTLRKEAGASCPQSASTSLSWACTWPRSLSKKRTSKMCHLKPSLTRSCWAICLTMCWLTLPTRQGCAHKTRTFLPLFLHLAAFVEHSPTTRKVTSPDNDV